MQQSSVEALFLQYGKVLPPTTRQTTPIAFKDHGHFASLIDIIGRKHSHHVLLHGNLPGTMQLAWLEAGAHYFQHHDEIPEIIRPTQFIFYEANQLDRCHEIETFLHELQQIKNYADNAQHLIMIAFGNQNSRHFHKVEACLNLFFNHPSCRILLFAGHIDKKWLNQFSHLPAIRPQEQDFLLLLKQQRASLEAYHHVLIPDETLMLGFTLAKRYLSSKEPFQHALQLIDSSAARSSIGEKNEHVPSKTVLSATTILNVLSHWTQIPASHLLPQKFKINDFLHQMQQRIFGQDAALTLIGNALQQTKAQLRHRSGPFAGFLFVGLAHTGKRTVALSLGEFLFKQLDCLYVTDIHSHTRLANLNVTSFISKERSSLSKAIRNKPHAILLIEDIQHAPETLIADLQEVLETGYLVKGKRVYDFRQAILVMTTNIGAAALNALTSQYAEQDFEEELDLMQLVMEEQKNPPLEPSENFSPEVFIDEVKPQIVEHFPLLNTEHCNLIPFLPHSKQSIEDIVRLKLKTLAKQLDNQFGIELNHAPEVIRYLAQEVMIKQAEDKEGQANVEIAIAQLYYCVEQAIVSQPELKQKGNQLFLQLNETGQTLRCDWHSLASVRHHSA